MAPIISSKQKSQCHSRSASCPSTSDQESVFNEFYRFQASQEATTSGSSSSSPSSIGNKLNMLNCMYETIEPLLTLPTTQQSLAQGCHKEELNKLLDELVGLLDLFTTAEDVVSLSIDSARELQSGLRRKRGYSHGLTSSVDEYLSHRKKVKKTVCKALSGLRKQCSSSIKEDKKLTPTNFIILKEMRVKTLSVFESLLTFILGSDSQLKSKGWSLVSKMMGNKHMQCDLKFEENEVQKVDDELYSIIICKNIKSGNLDVNTIQMRLAELESQLLDLDEHLNSLCKHLIRTRVSILNILNF